MTSDEHERMRKERFQAFYRKIVGDGPPNEPTPLSQAMGDRALVAPMTQAQAFDLCQKYGLNTPTVDAFGLWESVGWIQPAQADKMLHDAEGRNRDVSHGNFDKLCRDILNGKFVYTHHGGGFCGGIVQDAQHRLLACVTTNTPIPIRFALNLTKEAIEAIDGGKSRSVVDKVELRHGVVLPKRAARIVMLAYKFTSGEERTTGTPSDREVGELLLIHQPRLIALEEAFKGKQGAPMPKQIRSAGVKAAFLLASYHWSDQSLLWQLAQALVDDDASGPNAEHGRKLRNQLVYSASPLRDTEAWKFGLTMRYLERARAGKEVATKCQAYGLDDSNLPYPMPSRQQLSGN